MKKYFSLVKFSHTLFALPFALIGFSLAIHSKSIQFNWQKLMYVLMCMVFARSAAMAFNRYIDSAIDAKNPRTAMREIPSGKISKPQALIFVIVTSVLFMFFSYLINELCFYLSPVALLVILGYSYTKRFTWLCHLVLGLGLSLAPIGAYIALTEKFDVLPIILSALVLFWVSGFDIIYALQDADFDKSNKLNSIPAKLGVKKALRVSEFLHAITAVLVVFIYIKSGLGIISLIGSAVFIFLLFYQHLLVKPNNLSKINIAFFTLNGFASLSFSVFICLDIFISK
ncbi:MAG: UbiA family prenyltransferase [Bacteroidetes bacterium]|nr:UbiA family prenyltransferase [Bacteroidota bacterium]